MSLLPSPPAGARVPAHPGLAPIAALIAILLACTFLDPATARIVIPEDHDQVTVLLADGWRLTGVTARWSEAEGGLAVERSQDGGRRLYAPAEIRAVLDAAGRDVTARVLPAWVLPRLAVADQEAGPVPVAPGPAAPPAGSSVARARAPAPAAAAAPGHSGSGRAGEPRPAWRHWSFLFGFAAGYSDALEDDLLEADGGLGFDAQARLRLLGPIYLTGGYSWQDLDRGPGADGAARPGGEIPAPADEVADVRITGAWAGLSLLPAASRATTTRFYAEGGVGRYEVEHLPVVVDDEAFLGYTAGVGLLIPVGDAAVVDVGARGLHLVNLDLGGDSDRHTTLGFRVGISLLGH